MDLIITILPEVTKDLPISPRFTPYNFFIAMQVQHSYNSVNQWLNSKNQKLKTAVLLYSIAMLVQTVLVIVELPTFCPYSQCVRVYTGTAVLRLSST